MPVRGTRMHREMRGARNDFADQPRRSTVEFRRFAEDASPFWLANALLAIEAIRRTQCATRAMQAGPPRENRAFGTRSPDLQSALEPGPSLVRLRSGSLPSRFAFRSPAALRRVVALQGPRGERPVPVRTASAPPAPTMVRYSVSLLCFSRRRRQAALRMRGPSPVSACRRGEPRSGRPVRRSKLRRIAILCEGFPVSSSERLSRRACPAAEPRLPRVEKQTVRRAFFRPPLPLSARSRFLPRTRPLNER